MALCETFANTYPTNLWNGNFDWDSQLIVDQHEVDYVYQGGKYLKYVKMSDINDLVSLNQSILQEEVNKNIDIELIIRIDDGYDLYLLSLYTSPLVTSNTQTSIQAYLSAHYVLGDDIDYAKGYPDRYKAFTPIGYADFDEIGDEEVIYPFTGIFDGQGFEIKGLNLAMYDDLFPEGNQEHYLLNGSIIQCFHIIKEQ